MPTIYYHKDRQDALYINLAPDHRCTNDCIFCDKDLLQESVGSKLLQHELPAAEEIISQLEEEIAKKPCLKEIVFCGIGEPTLNVDIILRLLHHLKRYPHLVKRLNTNGHGNRIKGEDIVPSLVEEGLTDISISLNALDAERYDKLHRPKISDAFSSVIDFIESCRKSSLRTRVSFIESHSLEKMEAIEFCSKLGIEKQDIIFRKLIKK